MSSQQQEQPFGPEVPTEVEYAGFFGGGLEAGFGYGFSFPFKKYLGLQRHWVWR